MDTSTRKKQIAIFASGRGSNAHAIIQSSLNKDSQFSVGTIFSNKANAGVFDLADQYSIRKKSFSRSELYQSDDILTYLFDQDIDLIVLAGFLLLIPQNIIDAYPERILNIHPALLPNYGGKGMYGKHVHNAVKNANDAESGITIHFVNEDYDKGDIIFQTKCKISTHDSPGDIGKRVLKLEHHFYPQVVSGVVSKLA